MLLNLGFLFILNVHFLSWIQFVRLVHPMNTNHLIYQGDIKPIFLEMTKCPDAIVLSMKKYRTNLNYQYNTCTSVSELFCSLLMHPHYCERCFILL